jgi:hypothetical protein
MNQEVPGKKKAMEKLLLTKVQYKVYRSTFLYKILEIHLRVGIAHLRAGIAHLRAGIAHFEGRNSSF